MTVMPITDNHCLLFSPHNANPRELTASIQNERKSPGGLSALRLWEVVGGKKGREKVEDTGVLAASGRTAAPRPQWLARQCNEGFGSWGWELELALWLQTSPWEGLWGLRRLSALAVCQLLILQGSEPSWQLGSGNRAAFGSFVHSMNIYQELLYARHCTKH